MKKGLVGNKRPRVGQPTRPGQPTDFIALGPKQKQEHYRPHTNDNGAHGTKYFSIPPTKKIKVHTPESSHFHPISAHGRILAETQSRMSPTIPEPTGACMDCPPAELVKQVMAHVDYPGQSEATSQALICGAIQSLRLNRIKPDHTTVISLLSLAKQRPDIFNNKFVIESLASLLKKDFRLDYIKSKHNNIVAIIACSLIMAALEKEDNWPILIVKVFLDDSLAERIWVDHMHCQQFVRNVLTAFGTKPNPQLEGDVEMKDSLDEPSLFRFEDSSEEIQQFTIDLLCERLGRRQGEVATPSVPVGPGTPTVGKALLRTLASACGLQEVRLMAIQKLEMWLQNPKLIKSAQDLLLAICVNCSTHSQDDVDIIGHMTKMRLKSKLLLNHYTLCIKELIEAHPDNLKTMFSYVLYNELSNARNPSNMAVVVATLQNYPDAAAKTLASVCQDLLLQQEDYLRAVRGLLREIVRSVKHDMQFPALALGLMQEPDMEKFTALDQPHKDRFISSTCDLVCLSMLLSITPHAKEAAVIITGKKKVDEGHMTDAEVVYLQSKQMLAKIQHDALWWTHAVVVPRLSPRVLAQEFVQLIQKLLFLKPPDTYHTRDNWPPENERSSLIKMCHDCSVLEGSILRLAAIGLSTDHPLAPAEALEMIGQLIRRAASIARTDFNPLMCERSDVIDTILALCQYHHPGNIRLPEDYTPPSLAISQLYWSALQTLLVVLAYNPTTVGHQAWSQYPMLKVFMEMSVVNRFTYPPVTVVDADLRNQMTGKELQMSLVEKTEVLEFESHLAAATTRLVVTEESSLLLSQLIAMDPQGHPRRPPDRVLEQLAGLSQRMQLGVLLCQSRQPDFLLEIINRHEENQPMTWLPDLVSSTKGQVGLLPVQCLCEFLLVQDSESEKLLTGGIHIDELVAQLRKIILSDNFDDSLQVIQYFLKRVSSPQKLTRVRARYSLSLVLSEISDGKQMLETKNTEENFRWLLHDLPLLPHYAATLRCHAVDAIRNASAIESYPQCIAAYVTYLCNDLVEHGASNDALDCSSKVARMAAHLLINRRTIVEASLRLTDQQVAASSKESAASCFMSALLRIFVTHMRISMGHESQRQAAAGEDGNSRMPWSDVQDEIYVRWPGQYGAATLHITIPQASVVLLGFGPPTPRLPHVDAMYNELMGLWFSEDGYVVPQAYLMDTQEEALLLPDWLRLRMLRSKVTPLSGRLACAAVRELAVEQLVLFVQSFGVPMESMELLLSVLDSQCEINQEAILAATRGNAEYMCRLLDVQKLRGCKAGDKFSALLSTQLHADAGQKKPATTPSSDVIDLISDNDESMEVSVSTPSGRKPPIAENVKEMRQILEQLFSTKGKNAMVWRQLLQAINQNNTGSSQNHPVLLCVGALHGLISTDFTAKLINQPARATSLLRALDRALRSRRRKFNPNIQQVFAKILNKLSQNPILTGKEKEGKGGLLYSFVTSWKAFTGTKGIRVQRSSSVDNSDNLRQSDWSKLEEFLRDQLAFLNKDEEIKAKVELVAKILLEEIGHRRVLVARERNTSDDACFTSIGTTGLLVDWLQLLDPELLAHSPVLQRKLLFESGKNDLSGSSLMFDQAYLLSLLAEHCNWETIHSSIVWLLSDQTPDPTLKHIQGKPSIDPKTALDFLSVVIQSPKIWQGRENKSTSVNESVLSLNISQFCRLITYVVATEANLKSDPSKSSSCLNLFSVYFSKFGQTTANVDRIVKFVLAKLKAGDTIFTPIWWELLAQIYVLQPQAGVWDELVNCAAGLSQETQLNENEIGHLCDAVAVVNVGSNCRTDALLCSLLNRLGYVRSSASNDSQFGASMVVSSIDSAYDASLVLIKMAASRPLLVLRQLPLMASMLRGRTRHEFNEFKSHHHLPLMLNTIILLKMISPHLFRPSHVKYTSDMMTMFWQMVKQYCHRARRQMINVLVKTLSITHDYLNHRPSDAITLLTKHQTTLQSLMKTYHDQDHILPTLSSFQSIVMSSWSDSDAPRSFHTPALRPEQPIALYLDLLGRNQDLENQLLVLSDFDESSKRKIDDVTPFVGDLRRIFGKGRDPVARKQALSAAIRHARNHPQATRKLFLEDFISCLSRHNQNSDVDSKKLQLTSSSSSSVLSSIAHDDDVIASDVINFLPDITVLCREAAPRLLGTAFDAVVRGGRPNDSSANKSASLVLARSMWLLSGFAEEELLPKPAASKS